MHTRLDFNDEELVWDYSKAITRNEDEFSSVNATFPMCIAYWKLINSPTFYHLQTLLVK
ncbi:hypothetical protein [Roseburia sp. 1XD42-34]|uniref:hypothetical protein n=1 Tax=Roseburia sp. 1XD42-34 TaxID=2305905 RepID=UPI00141295F3|nr:hypothetical protein [Roseburia sp. 1XD42-34]